MTKITLNGVAEYCEGMSVELSETGGWCESGVPEDKWPGRGRLVIRAKNEGGHNSTEVDLLQLIAWLKTNRPDLLA